MGRNLQLLHLKHEENPKQQLITLLLPANKLKETLPLLAKQEKLLLLLPTHPLLLKLKLMLLLRTLVSNSKLLKLSLLKFVPVLAKLMVLYSGLTASYTNNVNTYLSQRVELQNKFISFHIPCI